MESQTLRIFQGDATTITETITGLDSLDGYSAKLYIITKADVEIDIIEGAIEDLVITYEIVNEDSKVYPVGIHEFETKIFDDLDHVYTPSFGKFLVDITTEEDPE